MPSQLASMINNNGFKLPQWTLNIGLELWLKEDLMLISGSLNTWSLTLMMEENGHLLIKVGFFKQIPTETLGFETILMLQSSPELSESTQPNGLIIFPSDSMSYSRDIDTSIIHYCMTFDIILQRVLKKNSNWCQLKRKIGKILSQVEVYQRKLSLFFIICRKSSDVRLNDIVLIMLQVVTVILTFFIIFAPAFADQVVPFDPVDNTPPTNDTNELPLTCNFTDTNYSNASMSYSCN